jgi:hypothetical protein
MPQPIPVRLGEDACCIPRKKGLPPEYYYLQEPISVTSTSDVSKRLVGVVISLTGDFVSNVGVMKVGIGNGIEVHIQYADVPFNVSKLMGNFYVLYADVILAEGRSAIPVSMADTSISAVQDYLDMKGDKFLKGIFDEFSEISHGTEMLVRTKGLHDALLKLGLPAAKEKVEALMEIMDLDENGGLDYEEFKRAVAQPPTQLEQWASMLPLAGMLSRSLPVSGGQGDQPLRDFGRLREDKIDRAVEAFKVGLKRLLLEEKDSIMKMFDNVDRKASEAAKDTAKGVSAVSKFKSFKICTGKVADFHDGLSSRIGMSESRPFHLLAQVIASGCNDSIYRPYNSTVYKKSLHVRLCSRSAKSQYLQGHQG